MKREILFRGKRVDNDEWVEGDLFRIISTNRFFITHYNSMQFEIITETVGQFTGLTDKNGNKIFEGDYIKLSGGLRLDFYPDNGVIVFNRTCFVMKAKTENGEPWHFSINFSDGTEIEIVGNIYDNPELLKQ